MTDNNEQMPDIDAGLDSMAKETTAAELIKQKGQRAKLKVMKERDLKGFINRALTQVMAGRSEHLDDAERQKILAESEAKVEDLMRRTREAEQQRQAAEARRVEEERYNAELRQRMESLTREVSDQENSEAASEALKETALALHGQLDALSAERDRLQEELAAAQADVMVIEEDLGNTRSILQTTIAERDRAMGLNRDLMIHATELVQNVINLDHVYYHDKHQNENPADEEAEAHEAFFHDFAIGAKIVETLAADLEQLNALRQAPADDAQAQPQMLSQQLQQLVKQVQSGSLDAVDMAEPVEALCEALNGARDMVLAVQEAVLPQDAPTPRVAVTAVPDSEGQPGIVLAGTAHVLREMTSALSVARNNLAAHDGQHSDHARLEGTLRQHMLRSTELIQGVLDLDNEHYTGRHQQEHPADEDLDAQEAFFHDYEVGAKVIETLRSDLARLAEIQRQQDEAQGQPAITDERQRNLFDQLVAGSLNAVDMAEPAANLAEAMSGLRSAAIDLHQSVGAAEPLNLRVPPDSDSDPQIVVAEIVPLVRELASALLEERERIAALQQHAGDGSKMEATLREQMLRSTDLVQSVLALDDRLYGGQHQQDNPADEDADAQAGFFHDFAVGSQVIERLATDLGQLQTMAARMRQAS